MRVPHQPPVKKCAFSQFAFVCDGSIPIEPLQDGEELGILSLGSCALVDYFLYCTRIKSTKAHE